MENNTIIALLVGILFIGAFAYISYWIVKEYENFNKMRDIIRSTCAPKKGIIVDMLIYISKGNRRNRRYIQVSSNS